MEVEGTPWRSGPGQTVCRCCLAEGCYKDISTEYFWMGKREVYSEMLIETFDVNIGFATNSGPNSNSRLICEPCIARLRDASEFKRQVQDCEKMFMQQLEPGSSSSVLELDGTQSGKAVKMEVVKIEKVDSDDDDFDRGGDDSDDDLDDEPLTKFATKVPKKESVDILELLDDPKPTKRKVSVKVKTPPVKKVKVKVPTKTTPKASSSKTAAKAVVVKADKKKKGRQPRSQACDVAKLILKHSTACPLKVTEGNIIKCCFCPGTFVDPVAFRRHVDEQHATVDRTTVIYSHATIRVDITDLKCRECSYPFGTIKDLAIHFNASHDFKFDPDSNLGVVPLKLVKDVFVCMFCNKKFLNLVSLARHSGKHLLNHICHKCGKNYETLDSLRNHTKICLSDNRYCRTCKTTFPTRKAKTEHFRTTKKCFACTCPICKEKFMYWEVKQKHMVEVHGQHKTSFPCTDCGMVFEKRIQRYIHFNAEHCDKYKCEVCGKRFGLAQYLKEHMPMHTGVMPYKCDVCDKGFQRLRGLTKHQPIHDDSKKVRCNTCSRLFAQSYRLKDHVKRLHPHVFEQEYG